MNQHSNVMFICKVIRFLYLTKLDVTSDLDKFI